MTTCGVDIGARTVKAVLFDTETGAMLGYRIGDAGPSPVQNALFLLEDLRTSLGIETKDIQNTVVTGYGRKSFPLPGKSVTEITCHARGAVFLRPQTRTVIDIGGQDSKVIRTDAGGRVEDFAMNDRCAAGTGRFLEMTASVFHLPLDLMGRLAESAERSIEISSMCAVFAESEIIGLITAGHPRECILRGVLESVAQRIFGMVERVGKEDGVTMTGGVAKIPAVVGILEKRLGTRLFIPEEPQIAGALGAALIAAVPPA